MTDDADSIVIGDFKVPSYRGSSGGQGMVRHAVCVRDGIAKKGEEVALKIMNVSENDPKQLRRLELRTRELAAISNENVVRYLGCFSSRTVWSDVHVIVQEFLRGETLKDRIARNPAGLDADEAIYIVRKAAEGLACTAERGIIHRDVKPGNIFICLDAAGKMTGVKLIDFEIAKQQSSTATTASGNMKGTFDYMAPDFLDADFRGDEQSDIFSLGVVLHEALTGRTPYRKASGDSRDSNLRWLSRWSKQAAGEDRDAGQIDVSARVRRVLDGAVDALNRMLAPSRNNRCRDYDELRVLLSGIELRHVPSKVDVSCCNQSYCILRYVGKGGFGEVYKARIDGRSELVAVKRLVNERCGQRFEAEAKVLRKIRELGGEGRFVHFIDFFWDDDPYNGRNAFLVMNYLPGMPGKSLRDAVKRAKADHDAKGRILNTASVLTAFVRYAQGLSAIHRHDIYHRDIKPSNLYFPAERPEQSAIMDFGIAKDLNATNVTFAGVVPGTLDYMAPEIFSTDDFRGDAKSDIYALGLCFYEALTGTAAYPPLPRDSVLAMKELLARIERKVKPDLSALDMLDAKLAKPLSRLLREMTDIHYARRLGDVEIVVDKLKKLLESSFGIVVSDDDVEPATVSPTLPFTGPIEGGADLVPQRPNRHKPMAAFLVVAGFVIVLCVGAYLAKQRMQDSRDRKIFEIKRNSSLDAIQKCIGEGGALNQAWYLGGFASYRLPSELKGDDRVKEALDGLCVPVAEAVEKSLELNPIEGRSARLDFAERLLSSGWTTNLLGHAKICEFMLRLDNERSRAVINLRNETDGVRIGEKLLKRGDTLLLDFKDGEARPVVVNRYRCKPLQITYNDARKKDGHTYTLEESAFKPITVQCAVRNETKVAITVSGRTIEPGKTEPFTFDGDLPADWHVVAAGYATNALPRTVADGEVVAVGKSDLRPLEVVLSIPPLDSEQGVVCKIGGKVVVGSMSIRPGKKYTAVYSRPDYEDQTVDFSGEVGKSLELPKPVAWRRNRALDALERAERALKGNKLDAVSVLLEQANVQALANIRRKAELDRELQRRIEELSEEERINQESAALAQAELFANKNNWKSVESILGRLSADGLSPSNSTRMASLRKRAEAAKREQALLDRETDLLRQADVAAASNDWNRVAATIKNLKGLTAANSQKIAQLNVQVESARNFEKQLKDENEALVRAEGAAASNDWNRVDNEIGGLTGAIQANRDRIAVLKTRVKSARAAERQRLENLRRENEALARAAEAASSNEWGRVQEWLSGHSGLTDENKEKIAALAKRAYAAQERLRQLAEENGMLDEAEKSASRNDWARVDVILGGVKGLTDENKKRMGTLKASVVANGLLEEAERLAQRDDWDDVAAILERTVVPPSATERLRQRNESLKSRVDAAREEKRRQADETTALSQAERDADAGKWESVINTLKTVKGLTPENLDRIRGLKERRRFARRGELRSALVDRVKVLVANEPVADRKARLDAAEDALWSATEENPEIGGSVFSRDEVKSKLEDIAARRKWVVGKVANNTDFAVRVNGRLITPGKQELFVFRNGMPSPWIASAVGYEDRGLEADFDGRVLALANGDFRQRAVTMALPALGDGVECVCGGKKVVDSLKLRPGTGYSCVYTRPGYEKQTVRFAVKFNEDGVLPQPGQWNALPVEVSVPVLPDDVVCRVNDAKVRSGTTLPLLPGGYSLVYDRVDYLPQTTSFAVDAAERKTLAPPGTWEPTEGLRALAKAEEAMDGNKWDEVRSWLDQAEVVSTGSLSRKSKVQNALEGHERFKVRLQKINLAMQYKAYRMYLDELLKLKTEGYVLTDNDKRNAKKAYAYEMDNLRAQLDNAEKAISSGVRPNRDPELLKGDVESLTNTFAALDVR